MMDQVSFQNLPPPLKEIKTRPLFVMQLAVRKLQIVGAAPAGFRRVGVVPSGIFHGKGLSGTVLEGGNDWQTLRGEGSLGLDVRLVLKTYDDALIGMTYRGIRQGPPEMIARLDRGESVDPVDYYFRIAPMFETAAPAYAWLNGVAVIGTGHRLADGPVYSVFEVL
jgi:hypothetical protein